MTGGVASWSYLLAGAAVLFVLYFHLVPAVFAGLAVHVLTAKVARLLPRQWGTLAHTIALAFLVTVVAAGLFGVGFGLWSFLHGDRGMAALLGMVAETLENVKRFLPEDIAQLVPNTVEDLQKQITTLLREHAKRISSAGLAGVTTLVHVLFGMVVGGMTALHLFHEPESRPPLEAALHARAQAMATAFDKVVFAQVKIAALNTVFTGLYLVVILPLCGVHLPMLTVLVPLTFVAGLIPVVGNLISNAAIVVISLGVSPAVAVASLVFLVAIHKLEYFFNARIVGGEVQASAWELLAAMLAMEAVFGVAGLVSAPVVYAWLKAELKAEGLI